MYDREPFRTRMEASDGVGKPMQGTRTHHPSGRPRHTHLVWKAEPLLMGLSSIRRYQATMSIPMPLGGGAPRIPPATETTIRQQPLPDSCSAMPREIRRERAWQAASSSKRMTTCLHHCSPLPANLLTFIGRVGRCPPRCCRISDTKSANSSSGHRPVTEAGNLLGVIILSSGLLQNCGGSRI